MRLIEPGSHEGLLFDLVFALKHHIPPGILRALGTRRYLRPGQPEDLEEKIAAQAILEHLDRCGWQVTKRPGAGSNDGSSLLHGPGQ